MKIYQHFEGIYPTVQRFWAPEAVTLLFVIQITHFEKHFEYIIMLLVLFLCLITFCWVFVLFCFLLKMSSFLTVTLKSVFVFGQTMRTPIFTSELRWQKATSCLPVRS